MTDHSSIADGLVVSIHYTLRDDTGELLDTSSGDEPLVYLHGAENIVPGLERALDGHTVGDRLTVEVAPADGYGEATSKGPQAVPRDQFPADADLFAGMQIYAETESGDGFPLWIVEVSDDQVMLDSDHPLAGATLHFEVEVTEIRPATAEEIAHGHPHGPGGHHH